jgi:glycerate 2-kinase
MKSPRRLRSDIARICRAALRAVEPGAAVAKSVKRDGAALTAGTRQVDLDAVRHIWILGAGKAAAPMARALERILGDRLTGGMLATKYGHGLPLRKVELIEAGHPLPDANSIAAAQRVIQMAESRIARGDLVFCLLSGGGSALLAAPAPGISLEDKLACTQLLLNSGAAIHEINAIRKHLSLLKGGGLARLLAGIPVISLILSDVVGDDLDAIASGPLVPDSTTFAQCAGILRRLKIEKAMPPAIRKRLAAGAAGEVPENPKSGDPIFRRKSHVMVGSNAQACAAAAAMARRLGYRTLVLTSQLEGDTAAAAHFHLNIVKEIAAHDRPLHRPACLISGGETTVHVQGKGRGGRNQEFALHCVRGCAGLAAPCIAAALATDGTDGPTPAAGALVDNTTLARSAEAGAGFLDDCLRDNNSFGFFERLGDQIVTGPTRTNVMDLHLFLVG